MFPIRDENPTVHTSVVTFVLIGLNAAIWVFVQGAGFGPALTNSIWNFGLIPGEILGNIDPGTTVNLGGGRTVTLDGDPNWWALLTSMFMHGGWFHLLGNMWFLAVFGDNVEDALGKVRFVFFYLLCGLAAAAAQLFSSPESAIPMVGASGAIGGVMGAYAILFPRAPVKVLVFFGFFITTVSVPAFFMLGYWFLLQVILGVPSIGSDRGGVAFWAHVGGFLTGVIIAQILCSAHRLDMCRRKRGRMDGYWDWERRG